MAEKIPGERRNILLLIKLDANDLFERVVGRCSEYLKILELKRTREHLKLIFESRFSTLSINELKSVSEEVIMASHAYYKKIEEIKWYLFYSEDMPTAMSDHVFRSLKEIEKKYMALTLYVDGNLGHKTHDD